MTSLIRPDEISSKEAVEHYAKQIEIRAALFPRIRAFLADEWEGKIINKRLETALRKAFPELNTHLSQPYSWYGLTVFGEGLESGLKFDLNLGYLHDTERFSAAFFDKQNLGYVYDAESAKRYREQLANYDKLVIEYTRAYEAIQEAEAALGCLKYAQQYTHP
jgi:hypothetical protein